MDDSKRDKDNYLYLPLSSNSDTYTGINSYGYSYTRIISISGNTVTLHEKGIWKGFQNQGWEYYYIFNFSLGNPITFNISGHEADDDSFQCQGYVAGDVVEAFSGSEDGIPSSVGNGGGGDGG